MTSTAAATTWQSYGARLLPFIRKRVRSPADADDILQEVLLRMHRRISALNDRGNVVAWMHSIARNAIVDHYRRRARHPLSCEESQVQADQNTVEPFAEDEAAVQRQVAGFIMEFAALLPSPYDEAIRLVELEGHSQRQAAEMVGISLSGMKSRVQRGRVKLRAMLEACCAIALDQRDRVVGCTQLDADDSSSPCCD